MADAKDIDITLGTENPVYDNEPSEKQQQVGERGANISEAAQGESQSSTDKNQAETPTEQTTEKRPIETTPEATASVSQPGDEVVVPMVCDPPPKLEKNGTLPVPDKPGNNPEYEGSSATCNITRTVIIACAIIVGFGLVSGGIYAIVEATSNDSAGTTTRSTATTTLSATTTTTPASTTTTTSTTTTVPTTTTTTTTTPPGDCPTCVYEIGRGIGDITGLIAEAALYGYASPLHQARGLHMRQYARAFIFKEKATDKSVVFVCGEITMFSLAVHEAIISKLATEFPDGRYDATNVMLSPTHTHSAPGGYHTYWMYMAPSLGFVQETFDAVVDGVVEAIKAADADIHDAKLYTNSGDLPVESSRNRSPYAYDQNPDDEKARYTNNVDKEMTIFKMVNGADTPEGMLSIHPVHTTSMWKSEHLVSSDNKGYAAQMFERSMDPTGWHNQRSFIAAFAQASEGDVTPRTDGDYCDAGKTEECDYQHSSCSEDPTNPALCDGYGPGADMFDDTKIIGEYQFNTAKTLFDGATTEQTGPIDYRFQYVNMSDIITGDDGNTVNRTCRPAMGYSFAAGATDGPGVRPFVQGELDSMPRLLNFSRIVFGMPEDLVECHAPKPILLPSGTTDLFWDWQPEILPLQILRIGDIVFVGLPVEVVEVTMAGRRVKEAVKQTLINNGYPASTQPIIVAMANAFSSYLTTYEEYQVQRYEGASTTYGPHTLEAYILKFNEMATAMANDQQIPLGPLPPDHLGNAVQGIPNPKGDEEDFGSFGSVLREPDVSYEQGQEAVVKFASASPRHDTRTGDTFFKVERNDGGNWVTEFTDAHWETRYYHDSNCHGRIEELDPGRIAACGLRIPDLSNLPTLPPDLELPVTIPDIPIPPIIPDEVKGYQSSNATLVWQIPATQTPGTYRITHQGLSYDLPRIFGQPSYSAFSGTTREFEVVAASGSTVKAERYIHPGREGREDGQYALSGEDVLVDLLGEAWRQAGIKSISAAELIEDKRAMG